MPPKSQRSKVFVAGTHGPGPELPVVRGPEPFPPLAPSPSRRPSHPTAPLYPVQQIPRPRPPLLPTPALAPYARHVAAPLLGGLAPVNPYHPYPDIYAQYLFAYPFEPFPEQSSVLVERREVKQVPRPQAAAGASTSGISQNASCVAVAKPEKTRNAPVEVAVPTTTSRPQGGPAATNKEKKKKVKKQTLPSTNSVSIDVPESHIPLLLFPNLLTHAFPHITEMSAHLDNVVLRLPAAAANPNPTPRADKQAGQNKKAKPDKPRSFYPNHFAGPRQNLNPEHFAVGTLVISSKSANQAYVRIAGQDKGDINITCREDRNRALNGDQVLVKILPPADWKIRAESLVALQEKLGVAELGEAYKKEDIVRAIKARAHTSDYSEPSSQGTEAGATTTASKKKKGAWKQPTQGGKWMEIAVECLGVENIPLNWLQKTGRVISIEEAKGTRQAVGRISRPKGKTAGKSPQTAAPGEMFVLEPLDPRMPSIDIPTTAFPPELFGDWQKNPFGLFLAQITEWTVFQQFPIGRVVKSVGELDSIATWTTTILVENSVEDVEFHPELLEEVMRTLPTEFTAEELASRVDMRATCIFTIDPPDAKDLDDAVSCQPLGAGRFRIGVHIADVTAVVPAGGTLDRWARQRATSVYLVNRVLHMLPAAVVNAVCSLDPGTERRCFSALFEVDEAGEVSECQLVRGIMRSRAKLSYRQAQNVIDEPEGAAAWMKDIMVSDNPQDAQAICDCITQVARITQAMRQRRLANGALQIDQPEFRFRLGEDGLPCEMTLQEHWTSCQLIEELALLTNMTVARRLLAAYPDLALVRRHPAPFTTPLEEMQRHCRLAGLSVDISSAQSIQQGMAAISSAQPEVAPVVSYMCARAMKLAEYVCSGAVGTAEAGAVGAGTASTAPAEEEDEGAAAAADTWHYALGVGEYTHMTSPIRRYADILVHRLLAAALGHSPLPELSIQDVQEIARHCNDRKLAARRCQEASWDLFLGLYVRTHGPLHEAGVVVGVYGAGLAVDVLVARLALTRRIFCRQQPGVVGVKQRVEGKERHLLEVKWKDGGVVVLGVWSAVKVKLTGPVDGDQDPRNIQILLEPPQAIAQGQKEPFL